MNSDGPHAPPADGYITPPSPLADTQMAQIVNVADMGEPVLAMPVDQSDPIAEQALVDKDLPQVQCDLPEQLSRVPWLE